MLFSLLLGRRSLIGHVFYGIRSALLVTTVLVTVPHLAGAEKEALPGQPRRADRGLLAGSVTHVRDGDTIELAGVPVRIANLDCPEQRTAAGRRATNRMRHLAAAGPVACRLSGRRSYDREIGLCRLFDGRDMGAVLVSEGLCSPWQ